MNDFAISGGIELQNLVKEGKLSQEAAIAYAEKCGMIKPTDLNSERRLSLSKTKEVFNFSVYKWNKVRTVQRLILQFDFRSHTLSDIQQGRRAEKISFGDITSYQSEDGLRLLIVFENHGEYELDANTLDEKNKMIRLLSSILQHYEGSSEKTGSVIVPPELSEKKHFRDFEACETPPDPPPASMPQEDTLLPPTVIPRTIKEGIVEKKGHSVGFLMWPERYLKVCEGELLYYKPEEREQALNIIPLKAKVTKVEKTGTRGFVVSLAHSKKSFSFRTRATDSGVSAELERDEWCKAILNGCHTRRQSDARLRSGTVTAKQYREEEKTEKKQKNIKKHTVNELDENDDPFADVSASEILHSTSQTKIPKKDVVIRRSHTLSSSKESPGFAKSSGRGKSSAGDTPRRNTVFYVQPFSMDVTTPFVLPVMEMDKLVVANRSASELLNLMTTELESLAGCVLPTTTGKSRVDMIVTRMGNIIAALKLWALKATETGVVQGESKEENGGAAKVEASLSPSSESSGRSFPSEGIAEGNGDSCSVVSNDGSSNQERNSATISPLPSHTSQDQATSWPGLVEVHLEDGSSSEKSGTANPQSPQLDCTVPEADVEPSPIMPTFSSSSPLSFPEQMESIQPSNSSIQSLPLNCPPPLPSSAVPPPPAPPPVPLLSGVPPPPAPPGFPSSFPNFAIPGLPLPAIPQRRPMKKMKRFHWNMIAPTHVMSSVWVDVSSKDITDNIDYAELENLFAADAHETKKPNIVKKEALKSLLDNTRSRNIEIFLPRFPLELDTLTHDLDQQLDIIDGATTKLNIEHIVALKRFQPTEEEKEMYKKYGGDRSRLAIADTFLLKLIDVPLLAVRLDLLFTIREFPINMDEFQPTLELACNACDALDRSNEFLEVLRYVLAIGNYLNSGTAKGNAYGFQLKYLPQLAEFRGKEKTSLLDFIVQQIQTKNPDLLHMPLRLESVTKASEISISSILAEIEVMGNELNKIEHNGNQVAHHRMTKPGLQEDVKSFVFKFRRRLQEFDARGQEMSTIYSKLLVKFGEKPGTESEDFFSTISQFLIQFKKVVLEKLPPMSPPSTPSEVQKKPTLRNTDLEKASPSKHFKKAMTIAIIEVEPTAKPKATIDTQTPNTPSSATMKRKSKKLEPKAGYLEKKSSDGKWAKRYFDLEQGKLHYFTSKGQGYRQTIIVRGAPVSLINGRIIKIQSETRIYHFRAKTEALAEEWLNALQAHSLQ